MATAIQTLASPGQSQVTCTGDVTIDGSNTITIGGTNATGVSIGRTGITTALLGTVTGAAAVPSPANNRVLFVNSNSTAFTSVAGFDIASGDTLRATKVQADPGTAAPTIFFEGFETSGFTRDADTSSIATFVTGTYTNVALTTFAGIDDNTLKSLFSVSLSDGDAFSFLLNYSIKCSTSTANMQCRTGTVQLNMYKLAGSDAVGAAQDNGFTSCSTGSLAVTFSVAIDAAVAALQVLVDSNLTTPTITANMNFIIPRGPAAIDCTPDES